MNEKKVERINVDDEIFWKDHNRIIALFAAKYEMEDYDIKEIYLRYISNNHQIEDETIQWISEYLKYQIILQQQFLYDIELFLSIKMAKNLQLVNI